MLQSPSATPTDAQALELLRRALGRAPVAARRVDRGFGHLLWYAETDRGAYLLKIANRRRTDADVRSDIIATRMAATAGVPVPEIVHAADSGAECLPPWYVQRWIPGRDAAQWMGEQPPRRAVARMAAELGELTGLLHLTGLGRFADDVLDPPQRRSYDGFADLCTARAARLIDRVAASGVVDTVTLGTVEAALGRLCGETDGARPALVHRDLYLPNVLVDGGRVVALLDFELAAAYDASWEFVKLENWVFRRWPAMRRPFVSGYQAVAGDGAFAPGRLALAHGVEILAGLVYFGQDWPDDAMFGDFRRLLEEWVRHYGAHRG